VSNGSILGHEYFGTSIEVGAQAKHSICDKLIVPFILGCRDYPARHLAASNTCESAIVLSFGAQGVYAKFAAVSLDHNLVYVPETMSPRLRQVWAVA
jgi:threonine dehydrogenase-like Zn-dependent dehydrogenase